jgi:hypothetical protein
MKISCDRAQKRHCLEDRNSPSLTGLDRRKSRLEAILDLFYRRLLEFNRPEPGRSATARRTGELILKHWYITAALLTTIFFPVVPAIAGAIAQNQNSQPPLPPPDPAQQEAAKKTLPPGDGRDEVIKICSGCHLLTVVSAQRKSESAWTDTVIDMRTRGANGSDEDLEKIVNYLVKNFGQPSEPAKENLTLAEAMGLATALSVTPAQAQAIIDNRGRNGKFNDVDSLMGSRGVDADKMDAAKDHLEF